MKNDARYSRRLILRGLGTAMALPFIESVAPVLSAGGLLAGEPGSSAGNGAVENRGGGKAPRPPVRMAFISVPNGVNMDDWRPSQEGFRFVLPATLEPLRKVREHLLVLTGLTHDKGRANGDGPGDHARSASSFLTGAQPYKTPGAGIRVGVSVDQVAAKHLGGNTRLPSLELGIDGGSNSGNCDSGYSCAYSNNISWASPSMPMAKEIDPRRAFDRLFASDSKAELAENRQQRARQRKSILDFVLEDSRRLRGSLAAADQRKLDEYFAGIRNVELRLPKSGTVIFDQDLAEPAGLPGKAGANLGFEEHVRLMFDLLALAFQGDATRIATFMLNREGSNRNYRMIGVSDGHHDLSHHQRRPEKLASISRINRLHVSQLAYFLEKLHSIPEGDGTLLDNCMIVYGSGISDGNAHNHEDLPVLLAGKGGGTIDTGRHVRISDETPMCNLFLSMLDRMGATVDGMGDSTGRLSALTV